MTGAGLKLLLCFAVLPASLTHPGEKSFEEHGRSVDLFFERTISRITDAWMLCRYEFQEASSAAASESTEYIKDQVSRHTEQAVDSMKTKFKDAAEEEWTQKVESAAEELIPAKDGKSSSVTPVQGPVADSLE